MIFTLVKLIFWECSAFKKKKKKREKMLSKLSKADLFGH